VGFYDVLRFVNWLNNGQPSGAQDANTTENGAYAITAVGIANNSIARNPDAKIFLPTENEWYKAAYYDSSSGELFRLPGRIRCSGHVRPTRR
jgi:formylglycine-generating enzyme